VQKLCNTQWAYFRAPRYARLAEATREGSVLDHVGVKVSSVERSKAFYEAALSPLGLTVQYDFMVPGRPRRHYVGFGATIEKVCLWIGTGVGVPAEQSGPVHICLAARSRKKVHEFYDAAIAAGAKDNGAPGLRPDYTPTYYAAFVVDPDGNNLEAVCQRAR
jgi:catechol 2,3-dioxygenase-like lactoylglutathione lyase family enzyme